MTKHFTKKRVALLAVLAVAASFAVAGYAYFTSTGNGSGTATVGEDTPWLVTTDPALGSDLTPGGPSQEIDYHVKNNSTGYQNLANVNIAVLESNGTVWNDVAGCSAADFELSKDGTTWETAGGSADDTELAGNKAPGSTSDGSFYVRMKDTGVNQDLCQNADVPLYLYAT